MSDGDAGACSDYQPPSQTGSAYCARYQIHLDEQGRFCGRCAKEPEFQRFLQRQLRVRVGGECADAAGAYCELFGLPVSEQQCRMCKEDALYRAFLRGQGGLRRRTRTEWQACRWRGELLRTEEKTCCGGKVQNVEVRGCGKRGEAFDARCAVCTFFAAR